MPKKLPKRKVNFLFPENLSKEENLNNRKEFTQAVKEIFFKKALGIFELIAIILFIMLAVVIIYVNFIYKK